MGNIKYKDEMELIYMLIDLTGIRNFREQDEPDIWYNVECGSTKTPLSLILPAMFSLSLLFTVVHVVFFDVLSTAVNGLCEQF
jgi:hypothetical protein